VYIDTAAAAMLGYVTLYTGQEVMDNASAIIQTCLLHHDLICGS